MFKTLAASALALALSTAAYAADKANTLVIDTKNGQIKAELYPDVAPKHVARIKSLANEGFYDGVVFHRVIEGFMAQTGDPTGTGRGGSTKPDLAAEFSKKSFERGVLGMARSQSQDSANSQFFIMFAPAPHLDSQYTVFGKVTDGMNVVDAIKRGAPGSGIVDGPDKMLKVRTADKY